MNTGLNFLRILKYESFIASWLLLIGGLAVVLWLYKFGILRHSRESGNPAGIV